MKEIWKDINGFEGLYQISNKGRVRSCAVRRQVRNIHRRNSDVHDEFWLRKKKILKPINASSSYYVHLYTLEHVRHSVPIKKLVVEAFMPEYARLIQAHVITTKSIKHKNNNSSDNSVNNLYVVNSEIFKEK